MVQTHQVEAKGEVKGEACSIIFQRDEDDSSSQISR
jgi:hypothetical protein